MEQILFINLIFSEEGSGHSVGVAFAALLYTRAGVRAVSDLRAGLAKGKDVPGEGDRKRAEVCGL